MLITVHVQTNAREERIEQLDLEEYKVWVTAIPREGHANEAVIEVLADHFNVAPSLIHIKSGNKSKHKLIEIEV
jgi:uncharacterized protein